MLLYILDDYEATIQNIYSSISGYKPKQDAKFSNGVGDHYWRGRGYYDYLDR